VSHVPLALAAAFAPGGSPRSARETPFSRALRAGFVQTAPMSEREHQVAHIDNLPLKTVKLAELKDKLSEHLRAVEKGAEVLVTDPNRPSRASSR
jgi:hypothetical protein